MPNTYRVVQWNTGNVGKSSLKSIVDNPTLELVGCYAWSPEKAGRDAGELAGIARVGVAATNDVDALLALKPDCVVYNPMWINVDELVRILSAGVNVVTTASFITGQNLGEGRDRIEQACRQGGSTMFGSGVSPGFAELLAIVSAMVCNRIDKISVIEAADTTFYDSPETEKPVGFGQPIDHPDLPAMAAKGTAIFAEAVRLVGDAIGVELDEVKCVAEFAQTTADLEMASWTIPAGCVAGTYISWQGVVGGKTLIDLNVRWRKGQTLEPDWKIDQDGWVIQIDGQPTVTTKVGFLPPPYFEATTIEEFMTLGHIMTAMPTINAIPAVVAAAPGIATYADLPLTLPRGYARVDRGGVRMQRATRAVLAGLVSAAAAAILPANTPAALGDPCPAVEVAFARGTGQPPGVGNVGQAFIDSLGSQLGGQSLAVYPVNYPATQAFSASAQDGANDLVAHVRDMIGRCPDTRLVLGGFSQGAGVVDLAAPALPPQAVNHVAAIAVFGNPTSPLARNLSGAVFPPIGPPYAAKTTDVCADGDPACSDGGNVMAHGSYVQAGLAAQAAAFVAARLQG